MFVEDEKSLGERARQRRWAQILDAFPDLREMSVLDLGGTAKHWLRAPVQPRSVHVVNIAPQSPEVASWIRVEQGDACALPDSTRNGSYDLVYSNSVIEHVGGINGATTLRIRSARAAAGTGCRPRIATFRSSPTGLPRRCSSYRCGCEASSADDGRSVSARASRSARALPSSSPSNSYITMMKHYFPGDRLVFERVGWDRS